MGFYVFLGGNIIAWRSKRKNVVAQSSGEAKFRSMTHGIMLTSVVESINERLVTIRNDHSMPYCDNKIAIVSTHNSIQHDTSKHIEIDRHFIKERLNEGVICMPYVKSSD